MSLSFYNFLIRLLFLNYKTKLGTKYAMFLRSRKNILFLSNNFSLLNRKSGNWRIRESGFQIIV